MRSKALKRLFELPLQAAGEAALASFPTSRSSSFAWTIDMEHLVSSLLHNCHNWLSLSKTGLVFTSSWRLLSDVLGFLTARNSLDAVQPVIDTQLATSSEYRKPYYAWRSYESSCISGGAKCTKPSARGSRGCRMSYASFEGDWIYGITWANSAKSAKSAKCHSVAILWLKDLGPLGQGSPRQVNPWERQIFSMHLPLGFQRSGPHGSVRGWVLHVAPCLGFACRDSQRYRWPLTLRLTLRYSKHGWCWLCWLCWLFSHPSVWSLEFDI